MASGDAGPGVPDGIELPLVYDGVDETPIVLANHFALQDSGSVFILVAGQFAPPMLVGSPQERFEQAKQLRQITIRTLGRFVLTSEVAEALGKLLADQLAKQRAQQQEGSGNGESHVQ